ncbi:FG-GAP-like repeat-containing protein [Streptomyces pharetrae]|uniref:FG-GAP-like repeat-containing protein n=1 Tax=Streptomyces pharetrae TaxID=291370 RepID=UPI002678EB6E
MSTLRRLTRAAVLTAASALALLPAAPSQAASVATWDKVAWCESTGNWSIVSSNGLYYGGLQITKHNWDAYGGRQYSSYPHRATKQEQILIAEKILADQGAGAWGRCGSDAGLAYDHADPYPAVPVPEGLVHLAAADFTSDGRKDVAGVEAATGKLWLYPGNGNGTLAPRVQIGTGWGAMSRLTAADFTGDGRADLLTVENASGALYAYPGNGNGTLASRVRIGSGWGSMRDLTAIDVHRDGKADLLAVASDGALWAYPGTGVLNGEDTLGNRTQIGSNWDTMSELTSPGDLNSDGRPDLAAVDTDGRLWAYPGNGTGGFGARTQVGTGWDSMRQLVGADFNNDGKGDLDAVQAPVNTAGSLYFYPGNGLGGFGARTQIGTGW